MNYGTFIGTVKTLAGLKHVWEAVIAVRSTLSELQPLVCKNGESCLADGLPDGIKELIEFSEKSENVDLTEFLYRISESAEIKISEALKQAKIVIYLLQRNMTEEELRKLHKNLPKEFETLFRMKKQADRRNIEEDKLISLPTVALTRKFVYRPSL